MMTFHDLIQAAPESKQQGDRPALKRVFSGQGVNLIVASFLPGQCLPDHTAAHPITVQCLSGALMFTCGEEKAELHPGRIVHVPARELHRVDCPGVEDGLGVSEPSSEPSIMLLSMFPTSTTQIG